MMMLVMPLLLELLPIVAASQAGRLKESLGASKEWERRDLRQREQHGSNDADARTAGHLRLLLRLMLQPLMLLSLGADADGDGAEVKPLVPCWRACGGLWG